MDHSYCFSRLAIRFFSFDCKKYPSIEILKIKMNISPEIMNKISDFSKNLAYELIVENRDARKLHQDIENYQII